MAVHLSKRQADWAAAGLLLVAVLLLFAPAVRHPDYLLYPTFSQHTDLTVSHWPKAFLMAQAWQSARSLPLWTPANLSGMPLGANPVAMRFYPLAWLFTLLPVNPVFNLLFVFHLFWGGLGVYLLCRVAYGLEPVPALAGGLTFALGGKLLAHTAGGHVILAGAMAWMPWALLGTHQVLHDTRWRWAGLAAVGLAMQITTDVRIFLFTAYLLLAYVLWELLVVSGPARRLRLRSVLPRLVIVPVLAAWLGAAQLLPLLELAGHSNRTLSLAEAGDFSLTPLTLLVGLLLPDARGGHEMVIYVGLVPLVLALFGLRRSEPRTWFFGGVIVLAALFALGPALPFYKLAYAWLPGFRWVRAPARAFLPAALAVAVLAGMGLQQLAGGRVRWSAPLAFGAGLLTLALGLGLAMLFGQANRAALGLAFFPLLTLVMVGLAVSQRLPRRLALASLALLLYIDLASFGWPLMRFISPAEAFAEGGALADYLAGQPGLFRTYSPSYSLPSHVAAQAGLQTADGVEGVHLATYDRFMALAGGYGDADFSVTIPPFPPDRSVSEAFRDTQPDLRLLGLLNVEYLVAPFPMDWPGLTPLAEVNGVRVARNEYALPRAWVLDRPPDTSGDWAAQWAALADQSAQAAAAGAYTAQVTHYAPDRIEVEASSPENGLLVLSEIWYPGWRAEVDGQAQPVEPVAGILRGVRLSQGTHQVAVLYDPASARWGRYLAWAGIIGIMVWTGFELWRRRRSKPSTTG